MPYRPIPLSYGDPRPTEEWCPDCNTAVVECDIYWLGAEGAVLIGIHRACNCEEPSTPDDDELEEQSA